jgi:putative MATE family efflux protein
MNVPQDMLKDASVYTSIYLGGALFMMLYNSAGSIIKSIGDSKYPAIVLVISSVMNVTLDLTFILWLHLGVMGAALATVISQFVSAVLISFRLYGLYQGLSDLEIKTYRILSSIKELLLFGMPAAVQSVLFSFSNIYLQSSINRCGSVVVSGWAVCGKLDFLIWIIADGLSITAATFVAQNLGADKIKRAYISQRYVIRMYITITLVISGILFVFTPYLASLFIKDLLVISTSSMLMRLIAPFYVSSIGSELLSGILRGHGKTITPTILTLAGTVGGRVLWISICRVSQNLYINAIIIAYPFSWILTTLLFMWFGKRDLRYKLSW